MDRRSRRLSQCPETGGGSADRLEDTELGVDPPGVDHEPDGAEQGIGNKERETQVPEQRTYEVEDAADVHAEDVRRRVAPPVWPAHGREG
jgi:hypothetical protein